MVLPIRVPGNAGGETSLYRFGEAGLSNAVKHGKAGPVLIRVCRENRALFCLIRDDSAGFNSSQVRAARGWEGSE
jgi:signal transduction histidine kinase